MGTGRGVAIIGYGSVVTGSESALAMSMSPRPTLIPTASTATTRAGGSNKKATRPATAVIATAKAPTEITVTAMAKALTKITTAIITARALTAKATPTVLVMATTKSALKVMFG